MRSNLGAGDSLDDLTPFASNDPDSNKDLERGRGGDSTNIAAGASLTESFNLTSPPQRKVSPAPRPRESLDGETIFAVGDDGVEWSEGEEEDASGDEMKKLTGKKT
jgi:hypothetical protein